MGKLYRNSILFILALTLGSCDQDEAMRPTYLRIDAQHLQTNFAEEGTAHHDLNTVWVYANNEPMGVYELPAVVPTLLEPGSNDLLLYPGINTNGIRSFRAIFDGLQPRRLSIDNPNTEGSIDTIILTDQDMTYNYRDNFNLVLVEDFDKPGLNFERRPLSDTNFLKSSDSLFNYIPFASNTAEPNSNSGLVILDDQNDYIEAASVSAYQITQGAQNLYLEVSYRSNVQFSFGLIADYPGGDQEGLTATVFPKSEWSKIYINLITELQAFPGANGYKILFTARKPADVAQARIYLDNLKLVYE